MTNTAINARRKNLAKRMAELPVTLEHAHMLMGTPNKSLDECLLDESTRPILFAMHALLCAELAQAHMDYALDVMTERANRENSPR